MRVLLLCVLDHHPRGYMVRVHIDPLGKRSSTRFSIIWVRETRLVDYLMFFDMIHYIIGEQGEWCVFNLDLIYGSCVRGSGHQSSILEQDTRLFLACVLDHQPEGLTKQVHVVRMHKDPLG